MRAGDVVTLRVRTTAGPTELVGTLVAASPTHISVRRRDGTVVVVDVDDVETGRVVPPGPARTIPAAELHRVMAQGWRAAATSEFDGWLARGDAGFTGRANSTVVPPDPVADLDRRLADVRAWYAGRGLPAKLQVVVGQEPPGLVAALRRAGWRQSPPTHVMTVEAADVLRSTTSPTVDVRLDEAPDAGWLARYREDEGPLPAAAVDLLTRHPAARFASVRDDGETVAIGRVAVDGRWAGLYAVEVHPAHRRRGLATAVVHSATRWAIAEGARRVYLQVFGGNETGVAFWTRLGLVVHHDYVYWTAPG